MASSARPVSRVALALLGLLLVTGCSLQRNVPGTAVAWDARREALLALQSWELRGRIGVKSEQGGGQGSLEWRQWPDAARLRVAGPFGAGAWELNWNAQRATLSDGDGDVALDYGGPDALDRLLAGQVGWQFPARQTRFWVLGIADPASESRLRYDPEGWLTGLEQDGWQISYADFEQRSGFWMPRKLTVEGEGARLRLVVDRWEPDQ